MAPRRSTCGAHCKWPLMQSVARRICDPHVLRLVKLWLSWPVEERDGKGRRRMTGGKSNKRGTPQGGVISPLLANLYMNRFLKFWRMRECGRRSAPTWSTSPTTVRHDGAKRRL
jgi:hypothetical protein